MLRIAQGILEKQLLPPRVISYLSKSTCIGTFQCRLVHSCTPSTPAPDTLNQNDLRLPLENFEQAISPSVRKALQQNGFAIVDGVFGAQWAGRLRSEIQSLRDSGQLHLNCTHLVKNGATELLEKSSIFEAELRSLEIQKAAPLLAQLQQDSTLRIMLSLLLPKMRLDSQAIKVQYNAGGGGCFPIHTDSDEAVDGRRLTAILYLNPNWTEGSGGELRLYPFPHPPIDIPPLNDRLVIFPACQMLHRVLPSRGERFCFTTWLSETRRLGSKTVPLAEVLREAAQPGTTPEAALSALLRPEIRKHVVKAALGGEWAKSIEESHPDSEARSIALQTHWREIDLLKSAIEPVLRAAGISLEEFSQAASGAKISWL